MRSSALIYFVVLLAVNFSVAGCKKVETTTSSDIEETAQQLGENMASIDEAGGSSGTIALERSAQRTFARLAPEELENRSTFNLVFPQAQAATRSVGMTFSSCTNNVVTQSFNNCTIGLTTFSGSVTFTWTDAAVNSTCQMASSGHSIARNPSFTITGRRGATLTVSKTGTNGQVITRGGTAANLTFTNDGIRRVFTSGTGATLFDFTTSTTSGLAITGASRNGRTATGGTLRVVNNLSGVTCDYSATNLTWVSSCICPTSGSWASTCTDGSASTLTLTGCGTGTFTMGSNTQTTTLDRCY